MNRAEPAVVILFSVIVCFSHIHQGTLAVDAIRYAHMAQRILETGEWFTLVDSYRQTEYANKPPLLFWILAIVFKTFGFSTFIAKLPSVLLVFVSMIVAWLYARQRSVAAGLWALVLIAANRSFTKDLVDLGFDSMSLLGGLLYFWGATRLLDRVTPTKRSGLLIGLGVFLLLQSKPPYAVLVGWPLVTVLVMQKRLAAVLRNPAFMLCAFLPVVPAVLWFIVAGRAYLERAVANQVGVSLSYQDGFLNNFLTWIHSFGVTLAPLSWLSLVAMLLMLRQVLTCERWSSQPTALFSCLWYFQLIPILIWVAVRPRYLWIPFIPGLFAAADLLSIVLPVISKRILLAGLTIISLSVLTVALAGVSLHRENSYVRAFKLRPDLLERNITACVGEDNRLHRKRTVEQTRLLLQLEFERNVPVIGVESATGYTMLLADESCTKTAGSNFRREQIGRNAYLLTREY